MSDWIKQNARIWDARAENHHVWSTPVSTEVIARAKRGDWSIVLTPKKPVPRDWFPKDLRGKKILCLASGGGQQGPVLAAAGADVTVFDNSAGQLKMDSLVAGRENLRIKTVQGNMQNLEFFDDQTFDLIVHPWSNDFVDDILVVWRECARVCKKGGVLLAGFGSSLEYIFDLGKLNIGVLELKNKLPYADIDHLDDEAVRHITEEDGFCWGHTLQDQIQGQIDAGFAITGFYEDSGSAVFDDYIATSYATKSVKM
ncbi:MAG: class I SAM-dependent methyltransferase [Treponema sp.]|nr:class I SAM-dependent methyltransferase [Treponema sp.]